MKRFLTSQQPTMPVLGFLRSTPFNSSTSLVAAFRQGLKESGFNEGQNVAVEFRINVRFGSKADMQPVSAMSALPPIADIVERDYHVRFVPNADYQRSISPNTMSRELSIAGTSASMCPRVKKSIAPKCGYDGARILHLYGWLVPSETR
jgi:hypothetical protein